MNRTVFRTCPLCEACCGLEIEVEAGRVKRIRGDRAHVTSAGFICPKGSALKQVYEDPDRLSVPLIKEGGKHRPATWAEAFELIDRHWNEIISSHGRQATAIYLGNPNVHQFENTVSIRPMVKAMGTHNVFSASTVDQMPKHVSAGLMFGHPLNIPVPDLDRTQYLLMLGANPYQSNGSLCTAPDFPGRLKRIRERGGKVVVVDPRRTESAAHADRWIPIRPGTDAAFLLALANVLFEHDLVKPGTLAERINGWERVRQLAADFPPDRVKDYTGIDPGVTTAVAEELATAPSAAVYSRIGTHTASFGTLASWAVDLLNVVTGNLDRAGGAMFPYAAHLGTRRGGKPFSIGRWHSRVRHLPEVFGELPVSTMVDEISTQGEGQIRFLLTVAGNPALTTPNADRLNDALDQLDFMVSVDVYLNETSRHANVVLPGRAALERSHYDLAFTGLSVRDYAAYSPQVFGHEGPSEFDTLVKLTGIFSGFGADAEPDMLAAAALVSAVTSEVGRAESAIAGRDPGEIIDMLGNRPWPEKLLDLSLRIGHRGDGFGANPGGLSLEVLEANPHGVDFGALEPRLDRLLSTESGLIELAPEPISADVSRLAADLNQPVAHQPLLVGRRQLRSANSWLHNVEAMMRGKERCTLLIHPDDAARWGLTDRAMAEVGSAAGRLSIKVEITEDIIPGVVSIPYGWGHDVEGIKLGIAANHPGANVNFLSSGDMDPVSGNAVLNGIAVTLSPVPVEALA
ncbi:MAG: molybdopterin-dependent oxidoreductase [Actinomycetota bacterium]